MENNEVVRGTQTLMNGLHVLELVHGGARSIAQIQTLSGLPKSTVHRLVSALRSCDYLRDSRNGLALGPALIQLGFAAIAENDLLEIARPPMETLSRKVQDTVHLAVEDSEHVLYLMKIAGSRGAEMRSRIGQSMPLTRTGIGKALLLGQPERWHILYEKEAPTDDAAHHLGVTGFIDSMQLFSALGFAMDIEENEPGIRCVSAPVRGPAGDIVAAISVAATTTFMPGNRMIRLAPLVHQAARLISHSLGCPSQYTQALSLSTSQVAHLRALLEVTS